MIMCFRKKTGCKQYIFDSLPEAIKHFNKKWYFDEVIRFQEWSDTTHMKINEGRFLGGIK